MHRDSFFWIVIGFGALGLLVGNLIGLTSESLVGSLISLLFVFAGGSILALLHKLNESDRKIAGAALFSLCATCILGIYAGILVTEFRWLSPPSRKAALEVKYLRDNVVGRAALIDSTKNEANIKEAYQRMYELAQEYEARLGRCK